MDFQAVVVRYLVMRVNWSRLHDGAEIRLYPSLLRRVRGEKQWQKKKKQKEEWRRIIMRL